MIFFDVYQTLTKLVKNNHNALALPSPWTDPFTDLTPSHQVSRISAKMKYPLKSAA